VVRVAVRGRVTEPQRPGWSVLTPVKCFKLRRSNDPQEKACNCMSKYPSLYPIKCSNMHTFLHISHFSSPLSAEPNTRATAEVAVEIRPESKAAPFLASRSRTKFQKPGTCPDSMPTSHAAPSAPHAARPSEFLTFGPR
jgi:hypothetical protein